MTCPTTASLRRPTTRTRRRGSALIAVIPIAMLMLTLLVAFVGTSIDSSKAVKSGIDSFRARAAAQSAASLAIADIWGDFEAVSADNIQMWSFRTHLDGLGLADQAGIADPVQTDYKAALALAMDVGGDETIDGIEIESVMIHREDNFDSTSLVIEVDAVMRLGADGSSTERRSSIAETFTVSPPEWDGLDYALLASNVNCLLCHTSIDNVERIYNQDLNLLGTFDSVRVGSIESIHFRADPDSDVAGVILIGGDAIEGDGSSISDWTKFNLSSVDMLNDDIVEDVFGNMTMAGLNVYDDLSPDPDANMFLGFFDYAAQTDYDLPTEFPSPFTDNGGYDMVLGAPRPDLANNRVVDDSEFSVAVQGVGGNVSGGSISVIAKGTTIASAADKTSMMSGNVASVSGVTDGNIYLHGTLANPLILDGDVAFDGDVIISGVVKGMGTIRARGNVFVTADLVYDDAGGASSPTRTFGFASDGTENNLAIASGGNIVVGDFFRSAWGSGTTTDGTSATSFNFTMDELSIFNRAEWMKTQPTLPGKTVKVLTGTKTTTYPEKVKEYYTVTVTNYIWVLTGDQIQKTKYKYVTVSNGLPDPYTKTWTEKQFDYYYYVDEYKKVADGTKDVTKYKWVESGVMLTKTSNVYEWQTPQHTNPYYSAGHLPRYYSFSEDSTVPIFNKKGYLDPATAHWKSDERVGKWDSSMLSYANPKNSSDPYLYNADGTPKAVVSAISPTANWIDATLMREIIEENLSELASGTKTLEIDATLYSANSILGTVPSRNSDDTDGTLLVNGGIVAADVGILAPTGTQVNYDVRGADALSITADLGLVVNRRFSAPRVGY